MTKEEKLDMFKDALSINGDVAPDTRLDDIDVWDSMARLSLIIMFKDEFGRKLTFEEAAGFVTVGDVLDAMG